MTNVSLYHLTATPLEKTLPKLMERVVESGKNAVLVAASIDRVEELNRLLWTYSSNTFLPHGTKKDGFPEEQKIWLTDEWDNPNQASILVLTDGMESNEVDNFERCLDIFDGNDEVALEKAQLRIEKYVQKGHTLTYWYQTPAGKWEIKSL